MLVLNYLNILIKNVYTNQRKKPQGRLSEGDLAEVRANMGRYLIAYDTWSGRMVGPMWKKELN